MLWFYRCPQTLAIALLWLLIQSNPVQKHTAYNTGHRMPVIKGTFAQCISSMRGPETEVQVPQM